MVTKCRKDRRPRLTMAPIPGKTPDAALADLALRPGVHACMTISEYLDPGLRSEDIGELVKELSSQTAQIKAGKLDRVEAILVAQAHTLDVLFNRLVLRAGRQECLGHMETFMRLGLKAQSQCARTLEVLATVKNPPLLIARQANIGQAVQVNNSDSNASRARDTEISQSKLSGNRDELLPDARASAIESRVNPSLEAVGAINRTTKHCR